MADVHVELVRVQSEVGMRDRASLVFVLVAMRVGMPGLSPCVSMCTESCDGRCESRCLVQSVWGTSVWSWYAVSV